MSNSPQDVHKKVLGRKGERLAAQYLKKQKYKIIKTNYRTSFGEVDLIAEDGDEIVFIEVKTRQSVAFGSPAQAVDEKKKMRYRQMAKLYAIQQGKEPNLRFDVIEIFGDGKIEHYKHAFY